MFGALVVLIVIQLLTFGGVLPSNWLSMSMFWVGAAAIFLLVWVRKGSVSVPFLLALVGILLAALYTGPKFAIGLFAGVWAWQAARQSPRGTLRFLHALLVIGALEALLGLIQGLVSPGWMLGYYQNALSDVSGTLINRNHFAGLVGMLAFVAFGLAYIGGRAGEVAGPYLYLLTGASMALALSLSLSRMGMLSFFVTLLCLVGLIGMRGGQRKLGTMLGATLLGLVVAGAGWVGVDMVVTRYASLFGPDAVVQEARPHVYRDIFRMIRQNPWGVGPGEFQDSFRQYQTFRPDMLFDHAHNDFLETTAEWGLPLGLVFWGLVFFIIGRTAYRFLTTESLRECGIALACIGGAGMLCFHGLADFNLQIPVNATLFFSFLGIAVAVSSQSAQVPSPEKYQRRTTNEAVVYLSRKS